MTSYNNTCNLKGKQNVFRISDVQTSRNTSRVNVLISNQRMISMIQLDIDIGICNIFKSFIVFIVSVMADNNAIFDGDDDVTVGNLMLQVSCASKVNFKIFPHNHSRAIYLLS